MQVEPWDYGGGNAKRTTTRPERQIELEGKCSLDPKPGGDFVIRFEDSAMAMAMFDLVPIHLVKEPQGKYGGTSR